MVMAITFVLSQSIIVTNAAQKSTKQPWQKKSGSYLYEISAEDGTAIIVKYKGNDKKVKIPSKLDGKKVTQIADTAFKGKRKLKEVTIPKGVISIGKSAFSNLDNLTEVTIPNTVLSLGEESFYGCDKLKQVTLSSGLKTIESGAFSVCFALTNITILASVTEIQANAFYNCVQLENIEIPAGVTAIGRKAFAETKWMKNQVARNPEVVVNGILIDGTALKGEVTFSNTVTKIGEGAFQADADLTDVIFPNGVTEIGASAFASCPALRNVEISSTVTTIRENAFSNCTSLSTVLLPKTANQMENGVFTNTPWLAEQKKTEGLCIVNNVLIDGSKATGNFVIPEQVSHIEKDAFFNCNLNP